MTGPAFQSFRVANDEMTEALALLHRKLQAAAPDDAIVLATVIAEMNAMGPAWMASWHERFDDGSTVLHFVPGPKLLDLLAPRPALTMPKRRSRFARVVSHIRAAIREALGK